MVNSGYVLVTANYFYVERKLIYYFSRDNFMIIKVGIIGFGYSATTFHIPLIECIDGMQLVAISSSKYELVQAKHPSAMVFQSAEELVTSGLINLAVITTPNHTHFPLAKLCLENGVNVVVEKPMTNTVEEAEQLIRLADHKNLLFSVFHNRRWDGDYLTVRKLLRNGILGDTKFFESHFDRFRPTVQKRWREVSGLGSGTWYDLGSHLVDQTVELFGIPQALTARCLPTRKNSETTDYFHVSLHYEDLEAVLHSSSFTTAPNTRFRIEGTRGNYIKYGFDPQEAQLKSGLTPKDSKYGVENTSEYGTCYFNSSSEIIETEIGCYQQYYQKIVRAMRLKDENPVNPSNVLVTLKIIELAEQSGKLGKTLSYES